MQSEIFQLYHKWATVDLGVLVCFPKTWAMTSSWSQIQHGRNVRLRSISRFSCWRWVEMKLVVKGFLRFPHHLLIVTVVEKIKMMQQCFRLLICSALWNCPKQPPLCSLCHRSPTCQAQSPWEQHCTVEKTNICDIFAAFIVFLINILHTDTHYSKTTVVLL